MPKAAVVPHRTRAVGVSIGDACEHLSQRAIDRVWQTPQQGLVEHHAQRVHVRTQIDVRGPDGLLRRHVRHRAQQFAHRGKHLDGRLLRVGLLDRLGQAEVENARLALRIDEHVGRLQIAVDHAALMCVVDRAADSDEQP